MRRIDENLDIYRENPETGEAWRGGSGLGDEYRRPCFHRRMFRIHRCRAVFYDLIESASWVLFTKSSMIFGAPDSRDFHQLMKVAGRRSRRPFDQKLKPAGRLILLRGAVKFPGIATSLRIPRILRCSIHTTRRPLAPILRKSRAVFRFGTEVKKELTATGAHVAAIL
ncbi:hypothetical protein [Cupriavidus oxalaticus]|uniref:hypothetical protein n=1 Tax=Cupriavidus oxalaticus TaxID=96344 RepID=UPI003F738E16